MFNIHNHSFSFLIKRITVFLILIAYLIPLMATLIFIDDIELSKPLVIFLIFGLISITAIGIRTQSPLIKNLEDISTLIENKGNIYSDKKEDTITITQLKEKIAEITRYSEESENLLGTKLNDIDVKYKYSLEQSENYKLYISGQIQKLIGELEKFTNGDLTVQLENVDDEEISNLFTSFNIAVDYMKQMILMVSEAIESTAKASEQISSSSEEMAAGATEQSVQTNEVASSIDRMIKTILDNIENIHKASDASKHAGEIAKEGGKVVEETIDRMNRIAEVVENSSATIELLGNSSSQIGRIIAVINEIADQTNLLALNAAIEAARAGESGRGFAVVADEVRKLAERTTKATKEISDMITKIQNDTTDAVATIMKGKDEVNYGKELAGKAGESLDEIIDGSELVVELVDNIAIASEQQSSSSEEITKNIETIREVTHQSAVGVQQIAHTAEDLNRLTGNLQELINRFRINA